MIDLLGNEIIQSIRIGIVGTRTMQWSLGGEIRLGTNGWVISSIVKDYDAFEKYGKTVYLVYGKFNGEEKLLKVYEEQPVSLSIEV